MADNRSNKVNKTAGKTLKTEKSIAVIVREENRDKYKILEHALLRSRFWDCLEKRMILLDKTASSLRIIVKPDLELFDVESPTGTDPRLVEHLIALLYLRGFREVRVVDSTGSSDLWLDNRDVEVLADLAGYRYQTDKGDTYPIINLNNDLIDGGFGSGSFLEGSQLGRDWVEADFRISMAKNKTSQEYGYSLGLISVLGVLPLRDKEYHYYHRLDPGEICVELLDKTPVHFSIIDAIVSNHGLHGSCKPNPLQTSTIIAAENIVLCDFAGAIKMGLDPYISPVNAKVLRTTGLPRQYKIEGELDLYAGWVNVPVLLSDSVRRRNKFLPAHQMSRSWFQNVNKEIFPFKNYIDERINKTLTRLLDEMESHPLGLIGATGLNYFIAWCHHFLEAYQVMYDKERIGRKQTSIGIDLKKYSAADYSEIIEYMETLVGIAEKSPPDPNGLKWRYLDKSVIFHYKRILPVAYDSFIRHVDISAAVRMMNDNIGGALAVVKRDKTDRIILQAERNIYLPQPNWMALFGGDFIDVCKLEMVRYEKKRQQIFWRTVNSPNRTAKYDDGVITFAESGKLGTEITVTARQEFVLPLFWQVFNTDYLPQIKDALVSDSYVSFLSRTIANYEAAYEGRDVGAGRKWDLKAGEPDSDKPHLPVEQLVDTVLKVIEMGQPLIRAFRENRNKDVPGQSQTDEPGMPGDFSNIITLIGLAGETWQNFFSDLSEAVTKDVNMMWRNTENNNR